MCFLTFVFLKVKFRVQFLIGRHHIEKFYKSFIVGTCRQFNTLSVRLTFLAQNWTSLWRQRLKRIEKSVTLAGIEKMTIISTFNKWLWRIVSSSFFLYLTCFTKKKKLQVFNESNVVRREETKWSGLNQSAVYNLKLIHDLIFILNAL